MALQAQCAHCRLHRPPTRGQFHGLGESTAGARPLPNAIRRLDMQSLLPRFAIVAKAAKGDQSRARELCAGRAREKLLSWTVVSRTSGIWPTLAGAAFFSWRARQRESGLSAPAAALRPPAGALADEEIVLTDPNTQKTCAEEAAPSRSARGSATAEEMVMVFLTENTFAVAGRAWRICTVAVGRSKSSSSRSNKPWSCRTFTATTRKAVRWAPPSPLFLSLRYAVFLGEC